MFWLYFIGLFPISLLLMMWVYELRRATEQQRHAQTVRKTILLVDDDQKICQLTGKQLEQHGFQVLSAGDTETALGLAKSHPGPIDLVIADVIMPGMSGLQLVDCMRANRPLTPVIFISGLAESPGMSYGAKSWIGFLGKPFNFNQLKRKVEDVMERARSS